MRMENEADLPAPSITPKQLNSFILKSVMIAGKVQAVNDSTLTLDAGDQGKFTVMRCKPSSASLSLGMKILLRGFVNQDLSVAESNTYPPTDLGETFDIKLYNDAAAVTSHPNYLHMFSN